jgi:UDP-N-acetylmuramoyl-tripeptide--D-alanyl-D-alanine ligase
VFPADDDYSAVWCQLAAGRQVMTFAAPGSSAGLAAVQGDATWLNGGWQVAATTPAGPLEFRLNIAGRHNVKNAFAAIACALAAEVPLHDIAAGLADFVPVKGRSRAISLLIGQKQISLVDDSYNSNPDSMRAAIDVLAELPGPRLLVMGDMGEVGDQGPQFHAEAGLYARQSGIDRLFTLGPQSALASSNFGAGRHFDDISSLDAAVLAELPAVASLLVKGSRFMKMERVVEAIAATAQSQNQKREIPHAA